LSIIRKDNIDWLKGVIYSYRWEGSNKFTNGHSAEGYSIARIVIAQSKLKTISFVAAHCPSHWTPRVDLLLQEAFFYEAFSYPQGKKEAIASSDITKAPNCYMREKTSEYPKKERF